MPFLEAILGATRAVILWPFLVEAVTLTSLGAAVGLLLGMLTAWGIKTAFTEIPAMKAARLDPVEALRYE